MLQDGYSIYAVARIAKHVTVPTQKRERERTGMKPQTQEDKDLEIKLRGEQTADPPNRNERQKDRLKKMKEGV